MKNKYPETWQLLIDGYVSDIELVLNLLSFDVAIHPEKREEAVKSAMDSIKEYIEKRDEVIEHAKKYRQGEK